MSATTRRATAVLCIAPFVSSAWTGIAIAQESEPTAVERTLGEVIVTARKREESILKAPVVVTAVSEESLQNFQITQITDLPKLVPGLVLGGNLLSIGPQVTIRGVGTSSYDPGVDQSVSLNIDGLSLGQGLAFASGMFDVSQVEVLKGPQSLFYGKSTPGGVISLRTADPTDQLELTGRAGYEFEAREVRGEFILSGPMTETLGGRLAASYAEGDGYFYNRAQPIESTGAMRPIGREPRPRNSVVRGTLLWEPTDGFSARLKLNHVYDKFNDAELAQLGTCPEGFQAFGFGSGAPGSPIPPAPNFLTPVDPIPFIGNDACKLDRDIGVVYLNPEFFPGIYNDGVPYLKNTQEYGTLELNFDLMPELTLTSTSAYYKLLSNSMVNATHTTAAGPTFAVTNDFERREATQELRLNSDFAGPINFTLGAFYEDGKIYDRVRFIRNRAYGFLSPAIVGADILNDDRSTTVDIETYSVFGQLRYRFTEQLELAAGARWTDEERTQRVFDFQRNVDITPTLPRTRVKSDDVSPEGTLTYTPTDDLTVFASYKRGFKSGSFKLAVPAQPGENNAFDEEKVEGYEIGLKSRWLDRSLLANLAFYDYRYKGLQVGGIEDSEGGVPVIRTVNAGRARTYGVDLDVAFLPRAIDGLSITASINWNHARYEKLNNIPCIAGQTIAQGCNQFFAPAADQTPPGPTGAVLVNGVYGFYTAQDLSDTPMIRAPEWTANLGLDYEIPVGSNLKLQLTNNNQFSSKYVTFPTRGRPGNDNFQDSFVKVDASIALKDVYDRWEVAVIGKNITDELTFSNCSATNYAGGIVLGGAITGGTIPGPPGFAENGCYADGGGRAVWVRLTYRPVGRAAR